MIRDYWPRVIESDWPLLLQLAQVLGMLDADGNPTDEALVWYVIGYNMVPTGETVTDPETGEVIELRAPETDGQGNPYKLANLATLVDLRARAQALAASNPELLGALQNLGRFFPVDAEGNPKRPGNPVCVRAGDTGG